MTLEQILTEEDKASILNEVERERRRIVVTRMYEEGMSSEDSNVRYGTAQSLRALALVDSDKFVELYEKGINDKSDNVRNEVAGTLAALATINPDKFVELYEKGITYDDVVRRKTATTLSALASINPNKFVELYKKGITHESWKVKSETAKTLTALASINHDQFVKLYEKGINSNDPLVKRETAKTLAVLAYVNSIKFVELYEKGMNSCNLAIKRETARTLSALASINPDKFVELYIERAHDHIIRMKMYLLESLSLYYLNKFVEIVEKRITNECGEVKNQTIKALETLEPISSYEFVELYKRWGTKEGVYVKIETSRNSSVLTSINPEKLVKLAEKGIVDEEDIMKIGTVRTLIISVSIPLYKFGMSYILGINNKNRYVREETAKTLAALALTIQEPTLTPIKDDEYNFLEHYLHSKYIQNPDGSSRPKQEIQQELIKLVRNSEGIDYQKLQRILEAGEAKDLDEMVECSKVNIKNYRVIRKVGEGAFKKVYLAESEKSLGYFVVLKQVNPSQFGLDSISQHYTSFKDWLSEELHITRLAKLKSPYVARLEAPIEGEDGNIYLVEEPFKETLREKLEREGMLSIEETLKIALQIAQGLKDAHNYAEGQIIHRDLKPSNIGLDENCNVKLTDFGSLESMSRSPRDGDLSNILHSAPEVLEGGKTTVKSNIYSVGVLLYEMLTGESLFAPRDETGKLKLKPKEVGEEREEYKREVLSNIKKASNTDGPHGILELITKFRLIVTDYTQRPIKHNISEVEFETYRLLDNLIEECTEYQSKDRDYDSIEEMIKEIIIIISEFEGIYNFNRFCIEEQRSGEDYEQRSIKLKEDLLPMIMKAEASTCLRKYKCVISDDDYKTIETALKWLRPTKT